MSPSDPQGELGSDHQEAVERRASASKEFPTNVTRSTQDLTTGGSEKDPDAHGSTDHERLRSPLPEEDVPHPSPEPTEAPTDGVSSSEQAAVLQEPTPKSREESPG